MNRAICLSLSIALVSFAATRADAAATVWMEFVDGTPDMYAYQDGAPGQRLVVDSASIGTSRLTVNVMANITADQGNLASMSTNLVADQESVRVTEATSNVPGPTAAAGANQINGFGPGNILTAYGMGDFFFGLPTGDNQLLGTISFEFNWDLGSYPDELEVWGTIGATTWATLAGTAVDSVRFGDGQGTNGADIGSFGGTFLSFAPEPSTLSLLGLGALALIRRHR